MRRVQTIDHYFKLLLDLPRILSCSRNDYVMSTTLRNTDYLYTAQL